MEESSLKLKIYFHQCFVLTLLNLNYQKNHIKKDILKIQSIDITFILQPKIRLTHLAA
jgi:hypothetical protein